MLACRPAAPSRAWQLAPNISVTCNLPASCSELIKQGARQVCPNENLLQARPAMGLVMIRCPVTGHEIPTGMKANQFSFNRSPVFFGHTLCPICQRDHEWFAKDAWVCELTERHESRRVQRSGAVVATISLIRSATTSSLSHSGQREGVVRSRLDPHRPPRRLK